MSLNLDASGGVLELGETVIKRVDGFGFWLRA